MVASSVIIFATWFQVQVDVMINDWFGTFYDMVQKALGTPGAVTQTEFFGQLATFAGIALVAITVAVITRFLVSHYIFRWRTAMNDYYVANWQRLRQIEGASQRVQEDTMRFATIMEGLGRQPDRCPDDPDRVPADPLGAFGSREGTADHRRGSAGSGDRGSRLVGARHGTARACRHPPSRP